MKVIHQSVFVGEEGPAFGAPLPSGHLLTRNVIENVEKRETEEERDEAKERLMDKLRERQKKKERRRKRE